MLRTKYYNGINNKKRFVGFHIGYKVEVRSRRWRVGTRRIFLNKIRRSRTTCLSFKEVIEIRISFKKVEKVLKLRIFFGFRMSYSFYWLSDLKDVIYN